MVNGKNYSNIDILDGQIKWKHLKRRTTHDMSAFYILFYLENSLY